jgi:hypothetical protein
MSKKWRSEFVDVSSSGTVSVKLGDYLKSPAGRDQLQDVRSLRDYAKSSKSGETPQKENAPGVGRGDTPRALKR